MYYVDTSAAIKLVVAERESIAMHAWLGRTRGQVFSAELLQTEFLRAVRRSVPARESLAREVLDSILLFRMSTAIYERAALLAPRSLRSLDALHLAAAMDLGDDLEGIVTYDERLVEAARANGIVSLSPR